MLIVSPSTVCRFKSLALVYSSIRVTDIDLYAQFPTSDVAWVWDTVTSSAEMPWPDHSQRLPGRQKDLIKTAIEPLLE